MSNAKWYIIENHNLSSYNHTGNPVIFSGQANPSALKIDGGVTPYQEPFRTSMQRRISQSWGKLMELLRLGPKGGHGTGVARA